MDSSHFIDIRCHRHGFKLKYLNYFSGSKLAGLGSNDYRSELIIWFCTQIVFKI